MIRKGFALPAVLAVTGVMTIIFLVAITALSSMTGEAQSARARIRFMERALTAEAAVTMMAATEPFAPRGIEVGGLRRVSEFLGLTPGFSTGTAAGEMRMDGRPYQLTLDTAPVLIELQDQAGLINLSTLDEAGLDRLATASGLPVPIRRHLWSRLRDYVDSDNLRMANGAEAEDYGQDRPANRRLLLGSEFLSVLGVREAVDPVRWRGLRDDVVADSTEATGNVNTATPAALGIRFGLTQSETTAALAARETTPILSMADFGALIGRDLKVDPLTIYTYPSGRMIFTIRDTRSPWVYRGRLSLTPGDADQPFWIDQTETFEGPNRARADPADAPDFPYPTR